MSIVRDNGETIIYNHLADVSPIQYQAMLAGFGYKINEKEKSYLTELHLRNFLSKDIETKIVHHSNNSELKDYLRSIANLGRITTVKKI